MDFVRGDKCKDLKAMWSDHTGKNYSSSVFNALLQVKDDW